MIKAILVLTSHSSFSKYKSISQSAKWQRVVVLGAPAWTVSKWLKKAQEEVPCAPREMICF
jgi:hypothetical protein